MIEKIIPGTGTKLRILRIVSENPNINLTGLIKKAKSSPNSVLDYVNNLEAIGILNSNKIIGKKIAVRNMNLNYDSDLALLFLSLIEVDKKYTLLSRYPRIKILASQINLVKGFALIYGSYARLSADKESDIDLIIVDDLVDKSKLKETLVTFPEISLKIETRKQFFNNLDKPLYQNILKEGIVLINEVGYLNELRNYRNRKK